MVKWKYRNLLMGGLICMTIDEMRRMKSELGLTNEQVAMLSGVPLGTVQKVFAGVTSSPRYDTLRALEQMFRAEMTKMPKMLKEPGTVYGSTTGRKKQGEYSIEDYYALPDERRAELIDGVIYDMSTPSVPHQSIALDIRESLRSYVRENKGECIVLASPVDVQIDRDDKTMVQPDVLVVCDRSKVIKRCIYGAPDLIIEVLSPSTRRKDMTVKLSKYSTAGVREYWLVDPDRKKIVVYDLENEEIPQVYGREAQVPVGIFGGKCRIGFGEIFGYVDFLDDRE